jgi:biofilm PGA synthesis N-glycosyltransferase PgaC
MPSAQKNMPRYVVISPVRNEAQFLETTMQSMVQQTVHPSQHILVDDGSTDATVDIIDRYAAAYPWVTGVRKTHTESDARISRRGTRAREAKEIQAFYEGYATLAVADWQYLVKIDGDVGFEPDYFEKCFAEFEADPRLGIAGGLICNLVDGKLEPEPTPQFHVRGATKIYRRGCWEDIGGVIQGPGWDTLDEVKASMLGWHTRTLPDLKVAHYRFTGAANGTWNNAVKNGVWSYIAGYHPLYMMIRCANRSLRRPYVVAGGGLFWGFVQAYLQRVPQIQDRALIRYLRQQQMRRVLLQDSIWK